MPEARPRDLLPPDAPDRLAAVVGQFQRAWRDGLRPSIDPLLPAPPGERWALLVALVRCELENRLNAGEPARVEDYLIRYPELSGETDEILGLLKLEYRIRLRAGPLPPGEFAKRFPQLYERVPVAIDHERTPPLSAPHLTAVDASGSQRGQSVRPRTVQ